jgi:hypothetical protein
MTARIAIVTAGHLSTSPRMLKAADALADAGYRVRVVSTCHVDWAMRADRDTRRPREHRWTWTVVNYHRRQAPASRARTGARMRAAQALLRWLPAARAPLGLVARAHGRAHPELLRAALEEPADLLYGGTSGALVAVAAAGRRAGVPYALDLEDFHTAEAEDGPDARRSHARAERIERAVLPGAAFLTAGSGPIAAAYRAKYGVAPIAIHNTFALPFEAPDPAPRAGHALRLYWFSQTIGPGRGLEDVVRGMGLAAIPGELHLRGRVIVPYLDSLRRLAGEAAPRLAVVHHAPAPPDSMVALAAPYDAGLSLEQPAVLNHDLCLGNKLFTYMLARLPVVLTATTAQQTIAPDLDEGALVYAPGDVATLAKGLKRWADDRALLARAGRASWEAARRRWHWEHPEERGALLAAVARA